MYDLVDPREIVKNQKSYYLESAGFCKIDKNQNNSLMHFRMCLEE